MREWHPLGVVSFSLIPWFSQGLLLAGGIFLGKILSRFILQQHQKYLFRLFIFAYLSRVIVCHVLFTLSYFTDRPGAFLGGDDYVYMYNGLGFSRLADIGVSLPKENIAGGLSYSRDGTFGYITSYPFTLWNVFLFRWLGDHPLSVLVVNCLIGAITIFPLFFLGKELFSSRVGKITATLGAFFPSTFLWSTQDLKDPLFNLLAVVLFLLFVRLGKKFNFVDMVLTAMSLYLMSLLREPIHWVFLAGFIVSWIITSFKICLRVILIIIAMYCFSGTEVIKEQINKRVEQFLYTMTTPTDAAADRGSTGGDKILGVMTTARQNRVVGTAVFKNVEINDWKTFIFWLPTLLLIMLTAPYPWQMIKPSITFAGIEMLLWYCLIPATLWGVRYGIRKRIRSTLIILLPLFMYGIILCFVEANIGLLVRHRGTIFTLLFIFTGVGFVYRKTKLIKIA